MKKLMCSFLVFLFAAVFFVQVLPVHAAGTYSVEITDSTVTIDRELVFDYQHAGTGDEFLQEIQVLNRTDTAYAIYLKDMEIINDSTLLDRLTFYLVGNYGKQLVLTKIAFGDVNNFPEFFLIDKGKSDSFTIKTTVGTLTNEFQGLSCKIRYTFEIIEYTGEFPQAPDPDEPIIEPGERPEEPGERPNTGDPFGSSMDIWSGLSICALFIIGFSFFLQVRKEKKESESSHRE